MPKEYIERWRAVDAVLDVYCDTPDIDLSCEKFEAAILKIPAADVAPVRRGRWIEGDGIQICSECGEEHEWEDYRAPYCDTCGARMNKEESK